ncbi:MAG TPA: hypothetical protein VK698_36365 [Kofleriaceae bacterium]|nr:hypothetical protein [Kofleriaceae bacterium]
MQSSLAILVLALVGCAGDPGPDDSAPADTARVPVALTSSEVATYKQELSRVFQKKTSVTARRARSGGRVAEVEGYANVALVKFDGAGGLATTCTDSTDDALRFLTTDDGLEVK